MDVVETPIEAEVVSMILDVMFMKLKLKHEETLQNP